MIVFISWSGDVSRRIGEAFSTWLPDVMQFVQPYFTPKDIEKGQRWGSEIADNLKASSVGLICVTADNLLAPWLMFEAGAISKSEIARVCPILFGVEPSQLTGPMLQFQPTPYSKEEVYKFAQTVNSAGGNLALSEEQLRRSFERCWGEFEAAIAKILATPTVSAKPAQRSIHDLAEETLTLVRALASQPETSEPINHWLLLFRGTCELGRDAVILSRDRDGYGTFMQLRRTFEFMKFSLNLVAPKISKSARIKEITAEGQTAIKAVEARLAEMTEKHDDIPF